jgi:hypothetical protein
MTRYRRKCDKTLKSVELAGDKEYAGVIDSQIRRLYAGKESRYEGYLPEDGME